MNYHLRLAHDKDYCRQMRQTVALAAGEYPAWVATIPYLIVDWLPECLSCRENTIAMVASGNAVVWVVNYCHLLLDQNGNGLTEIGGDEIATVSHLMFQWREMVTQVRNYEPDAPISVKLAKYAATFDGARAAIDQRINGEDTNPNALTWLRTFRSRLPALPMLAAAHKVEIRDD
jgi:hypothetical protein